MTGSESLQRKDFSSDIKGFVDRHECFPYYPLIGYININYMKKSYTLKPILVQCHISIPPENVRKLWFSDVFRGYRKVTLD